MVKKYGYYKFIAPANLALKGLPITKENIEAEALRLKNVDLNKKETSNNTNGG